jgi:hypothetical protein
MSLPKSVQPSVSLVPSSVGQAPQSQLQGALPSRRDNEIQEAQPSLNLVLASVGQAAQSQLQGALPSRQLDEIEETQPSLNLILSSVGQAAQNQLQEALPDKRVNEIEPAQPLNQDQSSVSEPPSVSSRSSVDITLNRLVTTQEKFANDVGHYTSLHHLRGIVHDKESNSEEMSKYKKTTDSMRELLDENFVNYEDHLCTGYDSRDLKKSSEKVEFNELFIKKRNQWIAEKAKYKSKLSVKQKTGGQPSYTKPTSDVLLEEDFRNYLRTETGKKMKPLSRVTVHEYVRRIFSANANNSLKNYLRRIPLYGPDFEVCQLMFSPDETNRLIPEVLEKGVLPNEESGLNAHSAIIAASALLRLIKYFKVCLHGVQIKDGDLKSMFNRSQYENSINQLKDIVKAKISEISQRSTELAREKKDAMKRNSKKKTKKAVQKYFRSEHMRAMLGNIRKMAKMCNNDPYFEPKNAEFSENTKWLMLMITFVNGARTQSCEIMKEGEFLTSRRATQNDLKEVTLGTGNLGQKDVQAISIKGGKTGKISLILPKRLYDAMLETSIIKKHVWKEPADKMHHFFRHLNGKNISLEGLYRSNIAKEVCQAMGIPRLTIQEVRRDLATKMLDLNLPPTVPTGMSHGHGTQVIHYDEKTEERGIQSKLAANEQVFRQEADLDSDSDSEHQEMLRKKNN